MKPAWEHEQAESLLRKRDEVEAATVIFVGIVVAALIALCVEVWGRMFP